MTSHHGVNANPPPQGDTTINSELEDLHKWLEQSFAGFMATDPITHTRASTQMAADYAMKRIEAIIRSEIAQEANKAVVTELEMLYVYRDDLLREKLNDRIAQLTEKG